jgi:hypothetical protein
MSDHLTKNEIEQYRRRDMAPSQLLLANEHLQICNTCYDLYEDTGVVSNAAQWIREDLSALSLEEPTHLLYEQFDAYQRGTIDEVDREIFESHLEFCMECRAEFNEFQVYNRTSTPEPDKTSSRGWLSSLMPRWIFVPVAAALLLAVFWFREPPLKEDRADTGNEVVRPNQEPDREVASNLPQPLATATPQPTATPDNTLVALNDRGTRIVLTKDGQLDGLTSADSETVKSVLMGKGIPIDVNKDLASGSGVLMGSNEEKAIKGLSPAGAVIQSVRPQLKWHPVPGAGNYVVTVLDSNFNEVALSPPLSSTQWTPGVELKRGEVYTWQVNAKLNGEDLSSQSAGGPTAKFKILGEKHLNEIERIRRTSNSHLLLGLAYAKAGLLTDAEREFRRLQSLNPASPIPRRLIKSLSGTAGAPTR